MTIRHVTLQDKSSLGVSFSQLEDVCSALQVQLDRDFTPVWGVRSQIQALDRNEKVPAHAWPMSILDKSSEGLGVHLDKNGKPYAQIEGDNGWTVTASHEMLEMLVDPLGHKFRSDPDIDPDSDKHLVNYLVEVGDPCEIYAYTINGVQVSDFITQDYYDVNAPAGTDFDFLSRLNHALEVPKGCYISWIDPQDGKWHQKQIDGTFLTARHKADPHKNPRDERDHAFGDDDAMRHDLLAIRRKYHGSGAKAAGKS